MTAVDAVLFDLDGTLVRYARPPGELLSVAFERVGVEPLFQVSAYYRCYERRVDRHASIEDLRAACFAALAAERGHPPALGRAVAAAFADERDHSNVEPCSGARRVLTTLAETYRVGVVTNGAREPQRTKLSASGLDRWVETTVVAGQDTPSKPAVEPFERALDALDTAPERAVHVGDSPDTDVRGATAAGLDSVLVDPDGPDRDDTDTGEPSPTYRVTALRELLSVPWAERADEAR